MNRLPDQPYPPEQRGRILAIARAAIAGRFDPSVQITPPAPDETFLLEPRGCFITLRNDGELRGCIGTFDESEPLYDNLVRMAPSASRDPRFETHPVTASELPHLRIEVSVLTPMTRIDDPADMRLGVDGIVLRRVSPGRTVSGCFLPEVATDQGWDVPTTLSMCCAHKMQLPPDAWRTLGDIEAFVFQSIKIAED